MRWETRRSFSRVRCCVGRGCGAGFGNERLARVEGPLDLGFRWGVLGELDQITVGEKLREPVGVRALPLGVEVEMEAVLGL